MSEQAQSEQTFVRRRAPALWIIILIKVGKAALLLLLAAGLVSLIGRDVGVLFDQALRLIRIDPEHRFFARIGSQLEHITPANFKWLASGSVLYATLLVVEGYGLMRRSWWAVWLAIGETAFFIPVELFELTEKFSSGMLIVFMLNSVIVTYLVLNRGRLFRHHQQQQQVAV